mmetsp:Transcript_68062/g.215380  ORF Transcript_68062/g.215380 Transcript_68062/m.215380 type:complete len:701 (+) Transcript_68062:65-2167(+)
MHASQPGRLGLVGVLHAGVHAVCSVWPRLPAGEVLGCRNGALQLADLLLGLGAVSLELREGPVCTGDGRLVGGHERLGGLCELLLRLLHPCFQSLEVRLQLLPALLHLGHRLLQRGLLLGGDRLLLDCRLELVSGVRQRALGSSQGHLQLFKQLRGFLLLLRELVDGGLQLGDQLVVGAIFSPSNEVLEHGVPAIVDALDPLKVGELARFDELVLLRLCLLHRELLVQPVRVQPRRHRVHVGLDALSPQRDLLAQVGEDRVSVLEAAQRRQVQVDKPLHLVEGGLCRAFAVVLHGADAVLRDGCRFCLLGIGERDLLEVLGELQLEDGLLQGGFGELHHHHHGLRHELLQLADLVVGRPRLHELLAQAVQLGLSASHLAHQVVLLFGRRFEGAPRVFSRRPGLVEELRRLRQALLLGLQVVLHVREVVHGVGQGELGLLQLLEASAVGLLQLHQLIPEGLQVRIVAVALLDARLCLVQLFLRLQKLVLDLVGTACRLAEHLVGVALRRVREVRAELLAVGVLGQVAAHQRVVADLPELQPLQLGLLLLEELLRRIGEEGLALLVGAPWRALSLAADSGLAALEDHGVVHPVEAALPHAFLDEFFGMLLRHVRHRFLLQHFLETLPKPGQLLRREFRLHLLLLHVLILVRLNLLPLDVLRGVERRTACCELVPDVRSAADHVGFLHDPVRHGGQLGCKLLN